MAFPLRLLVVLSALALPIARAERLSDRIASVAEEPVRSGEVPGILIGLSTPGQGAMIITRGTADLQTGAPMARANSQRIGSITKSFTVTRLLQLADEGRLALDDPISKYVSNVRNGRATLRELADMTSGIFNYTEDTPFILDFVSDLTKRWTDRELVNVADNHAPYFAPGTAWHYSNTNTVLLGMVVERVTGRPLGGELTRHVIQPLGLRHTLYPTGNTMPAPFSHGYATFNTDLGRQDVTAVSPTASAGSGAIISTVDDLFVWGRALARGSLVSKESQLARLQMVDSSQGIGPYYNRYGLALGRINGWIGHTGDLVGFQSLVMHNLVSGQTVVIFVNASNPAHIPTELFQQMTRFLPSALPNRPVQMKTKRHRVTTQERLTIRGRASSPAGVLLVGRGSTRLADRPTRGAESWRFKASLRPGRNVFFVRATDHLGRTSRISRIIVQRN